MMLLIMVMLIAIFPQWSCYWMYQFLKKYILCVNLRINIFSETIIQKVIEFVGVHGGGWVGVGGGRGSLNL